MKARVLTISLLIAAVLAVAIAPFALFTVDYARARACVNQFIRSTASAEPKCDTVKIDTDTDKKFGGVAVTADGTELNYLDGSTPGTSVASKAAVLGTDKNLDVLALPVSGLKIGAGAGTAMDATAAELNKLAGVTAGTTTASKALVGGANKELDVLALPVSGLKIGAGAGTAVDRTAAELNTLVQGVAAGYKLARGQVTLDGSNPTPVATGLATIVNCTASYQGTAAPGLDPTALHVNPNGTNLDVYAWKPTAVGDATLIASTNATAVVSWVCVGT